MDGGRRISVEDGGGVGIKEGGRMPVKNKGYLRELKILKRMETRIGIGQKLVELIPQELGPLAYKVIMREWVERDRSFLANLKKSLKAARDERNKE